MPLITRLSNTGTLFVNGIFDEYTSITPSKFRTTLNTVYSGQLDEVTGMSTLNGLIFYVDPGKNSSYVGSGSKIREIQNNSVIGTTQNSPTFTSTAPGYFTYNGTTQYIDFGNVALAEVQDKTIMAWIYITSSLASPSGIIDKDFDNGDPNYGGWGFWAGPITGGNGVWFWTQSNKDLKDTTVLALNTWYHVAVVWNYASKSATFYVNGVQKSTQTDATIVEKVSDTTSLKIGLFRSTYYFPGRIGAVQVYNRQLTANEILNNYNTDASRYGYTSTIAVPTKRENSNGALQVTNIFDEFTGAPIVDSNLKFWIDSAQTTSYSGSGNTWIDLTTSAANVTLFNSPTFSSLTNGGIITFSPSSSQYGNTSINLGDMPIWTIESWFRVTSSLTNQVTTVMTNVYDGTTKLNYSMGTNNAGLVAGAAQWYISVGFFDGSWHNTTGFAPVLNTWYHCVGTYDGSNVIQYVNGVQNSTLNYSGTPSSGGAIRIARRWDDVVTSTNLFPGDISLVKIYNRALSLDEITTNYNALRNRYGI